MSITLDQVIAVAGQTKWYEWKKRRDLMTTALQEIWDVAEALAKNTPVPEGNNDPDYRESDTYSSHPASGQDNMVNYHSEQWATEPTAKFKMGFQAR